jgi:hypothetical protein
VDVSLSDVQVRWAFTFYQKCQWSQAKSLSLGWEDQMEFFISFQIATTGKSDNTYHILTWVKAPTNMSMKSLGNNFSKVNSCFQTTTAGYGGQQQYIVFSLVHRLAQTWASSCLATHFQKKFSYLFKSPLLAIAIVCTSYSHLSKGSYKHEYDITWQWDFNRKFPIFSNSHHQQWHSLIEIGLEHQPFVVLVYFFPHLNMQKTADYGPQRH